MHFQILGLNHQTAPVAVRERIAFPAENLPMALREFMGACEVEEAAILSTCNRTEIYTSRGNGDAAIDWLAHTSRITAQQIRGHLYHHEEMAAMKHAFRVASGLDSMVLGEPQILGQLKQAVRIAEQEGTLGPLLNPLFQRTFAVAKEVRTNTEIGANSVSMAAAAVRLAQNIFGDFGDLGILFIGAGEMIELAAAHFVAQAPKKVMVANRTIERGEELAQRLGGTAITLAELPNHISDFDIVVTSTASTLPILGKGLVERAIRARKHRPMFMVDLAVPRDIEPEVGELEDVFLYTVDDLGHIIEEGLDKRRQAVSEAEAIIDTRAAEFAVWLNGRAAAPTIRRMRDYAEQYRNIELARAQSLLTRGEDPTKVLESFSRALLNKFLHHPTVALNQAAPEERKELAKLLNRLYQLPEEE
ncbi:MAG: glutamyl-tRNA reductase [Pseudomonadota bacterium]